MKQLTFLLSLAVLLLMGSCAKEDPFSIDSDEKVIYEFTAQLPGYIDSRGIGDGECADELFFWVYDENNHELSALRQHNIAFNNQGIAKVDVSLTPGHTYSFAFWAQHKDCKAYNPNNPDRIMIDYWGDDENPVLANDDLRDAFYAFKPNITVGANGETVQETISLRRVFTQLNYGIHPDAFNAIKNAGFDLTDAQVEVKVSKAYTQFGLLQGEPIETIDNYVGGEDEEEYLTFHLNAMPNGIPNDKLKKIWWDNPDPNGQSGYINYIWLSFNYFLTTVSTESLINTKIKIVTKDGRVFESPMFDSRVVQGNWRTNILVDFFTEDVTFNVVIDQNFDDYDHIVDVNAQGAPGFLKPDYGMRLPLSDLLKPVGYFNK